MRLRQRRAARDARARDWDPLGRFFKFTYA